MDEIVKKALEHIREHDELTLKEQLEMVQIPAPSGLEQKKAEYVLKKFREIGLEDAFQDEVGNVFGTRKGYANGSRIMLAGHLDTVFPMNTDLTIRKEGERYYCPGINDDTRAVAELLAIARAMVDTGLRAKGDTIFCANVCEEGLGDLKGVKHIFQTRKDIDAFITIDNEYTGAIICIATGSRRFEVTMEGKGGHSFGDFGLPNPIHALGRAISEISEIQVPEEPKTTFNVGVIQGGTSVNTISQKASFLMDIRSTDEKEIQKLVDKFIAAVEKAVNQENQRWNHPTEKVTCTITEIGNRPAGSISTEDRLVQKAIQANQEMELETILDIASSTDANIPISLGIPAITVGRGGNEANVHTLEEWFEPKEAWLGPQRDLLLLMSL